MDLWSTFEKGGPIMWPLLLTSIVSLAVVLERLVFIVRERQARQPAQIAEVLLRVEQGRVDEAIRVGEGSRDFVVRTLLQGLRHRDGGLANALLQAAALELRRFGQGLTVMDTVITLAPLLGLLGTVTGMIRSFGLLGTTELAAPAAITGGIAEALIATAAGLGIAIVALIPFNYLNARLEEARHEIEDAATRLELLLQRERSA